MSGQGGRRTPVVFGGEPEAVPPPAGGFAAPLGRALAWFAVFLIHVYRSAIAPQLVGACRFTPSCSRYAEEAISRFGLWNGGGMALRRLMRCHPFHPGGWDPVPESLRGGPPGGGG